MNKKEEKIIIGLLGAIIVLMLILLAFFIMPQGTEDLKLATGDTIDVPKGTKSLYTSDSINYYKTPKGTYIAELIFNDADNIAESTYVHFYEELDNKDALLSDIAYDSGDTHINIDHNPNNIRREILITPHGDELDNNVAVFIIGNDVNEVGAIAGSVNW